MLEYDIDMVYFSFLKINNRNVHKKDAANSKRSLAKMPEKEEPFSHTKFSSTDPKI